MKARKFRGGGASAPTFNDPVVSTRFLLKIPAKMYEMTQFSKLFATNVVF